MDPAGPFFRDKNANARLDETDAHFVDVIHTNGGCGFNSRILSSVVYMYIVMSKINFG